MIASTSISITASRALHRQAAAARGRLMLWCGLVVLLLQLFAAFGHVHRDDSDNDVDTPDCVACSLQAQSHAAPPGAQPAPAAVAWSLAFSASAPRTLALLPVHISELLPQPHAPPAALSF